ncbi:alpha,alpha-trehalose-phosphate synthase (UDP-forming) [Frateuria aurantia]|uniref:Trehalose-6-phosphate synthase n=1 Tax=Frateuria aurantia (strain ATCC 33424 / DSM 6220 / KCTC 2777 / LMG 1558 / NBRC 3245 / NCIMB 13370) TaxID=767434 RepID=H8L165_FRAAD|nr:trehalose-6-phosphate synthase [Frateuria aurantia]AFC87220.1 Trehalose-6-phosphate synthase [Frateuria aurantia DSM 6220]
MPRLVIVSNRVALPRQTSTGGLGSAMHAATREQGGLWFGWSGKLAEHSGAVLHRQQHEQVDYVTMDLSRTDHDQYYAGFANRALWPLFHYRAGLVEYRRANMEGYLRVNELFADRLLPLLQPDDTIWVHDYHLIPLGALLRQRGVANRIGFFLHTPLPAAGLLIALPRHQELLGSLASYHLVGLHTERDQRALDDYFLHEAGARRLADGRLQDAAGACFRTRAFPISIDTGKVARQAERASRGLKIRQLRDSLGTRALVIGVDRLDYSKGLPERFKAYGRLLDRQAGLRKQVSFLQIAPHSRDTVPEYRQLRHQLERSAGHINGRYAEPDWTPISYVNRSFPHQLLTGYYRVARVGLVTPLRDGMNLVAKEYIASQDALDPGVLVLSRFAGAAQELDSALLVNPSDTEEVTEALETALSMPLQERQRRWRPMYEHLCRYDVNYWCKDFLDTLRQQPTGAIAPATVPPHQPLPAKLRTD